MIKVKKSEEDTRFLDVWISLRKQERTSILQYKKEVGKLTCILRYKKLSASQIIYINNIILLLKLEYLLANICLKKKSYDTIYQPMLRLIKYKLKLLSTCANTTL